MKIDSCSLFLHFFSVTGFEMFRAERLSVCFWKRPEVLTQWESCLFYTNIPNVEACNLCTNSGFSHKVLLRNCKGLRNTCMCSALLVWNKAYSFPLLPLPVQIKGSMPCGCSWKGKLMFIQLFTLPQKPHLTSEKSLFPPSPCGLWECLMCSYLMGILILYCSDGGGKWIPRRGGKHAERGRKMARD